MNRPPKYWYKAKKILSRRDPVLRRIIKKYNKGFYIHYKFEGNKETVEKIKKNISIDNSVLRHLTIKYKKLDLEKEYFKKENLENEKKK